MPKEITPEQDPTSLPSMHIDHSAVFVNELSTRLAGFESGIAAIVADMDGQQRQYEAESAERAKAHATAMEKRHALKRDLERERRMTLAAQAAYSEDIPVDIEEPDVA